MVIDIRRIWAKFSQGQFNYSSHLCSSHNPSEWFSFYFSFCMLHLESYNCCLPHSCGLLLRSNCSLKNSALDSFKRVFSAVWTACSVNTAACGLVAERAWSISRCRRRFEEDWRFCFCRFERSEIGFRSRCRNSALRGLLIVVCNGVGVFGHSITNHQKGSAGKKIANSHVFAHAD